MCTMLIPESATNNEHCFGRKQQGTFERKIVSMHRQVYIDAKTKIPLFKYFASSTKFGVWELVQTKTKNLIKKKSRIPHARKTGPFHENIRRTLYVLIQCRSHPPKVLISSPFLNASPEKQRLGILVASSPADTARSRTNRSQQSSREKSPNDALKTVLKEE